MKLLHQGDHRLKLSYRRSLEFPLHMQNAVEILLLTSGQITAVYGKKRISLQAGDLLVVFPNQVHGFEDSQSAEGYVMIIPMHPYLAAYHSTMDQKAPTDPVLHENQWAPSGIDSLLEMGCREWPTADPGLRQGYVLVIMGKLLSMLPLTDVKHVSADALQETLIYLNGHYREPLTREGIAKAVGYNESYLSHVFSEALHITMKDYITSLRIREADHLLLNTGMTVSDISASVGFGSIRSFNRAFAKAMGHTPTDYRTACKAATQ